MKNDQDMSSAPSNAPSNSPETEKIVDLGSFRRRKVLEQELARGRNPLFVSHLKGKISDGPNAKPSNDTVATGDFGDRLQRIKSSLNKINQLMVELKKISADQKNTVH